MLHELLCRQRQMHGIWGSVRGKTSAAAAQHALLAPQQPSLRLEQHRASACCETRCLGAGINNCTASGSTCGPTHGQLQDGQSYLCVSFDPQNLDAVAEVSPAPVKCCGLPACSRLLMQREHPQRNGCQNHCPPLTSSMA